MNNPVELEYATEDFGSHVRKTLTALAWANLIWAGGHLISSAGSVLPSVLQPRRSTFSIGYGPPWYSYVRIVAELLPILGIAAAALMLLIGRSLGLKWLFWCSVGFVALAAEGQFERQLLAGRGSSILVEPWRITFLFWTLAASAMPILNMFMFRENTRSGWLAVLSTRGLASQDSICTEGQGT